MEPQDQPGEYKKLEVKQYAPRSIRETAENRFWKKFKAPVIAKQVGHRRSCRTRAARGGLPCLLHF